MKFNPRCLFLAGWLLLGSSHAQAGPHLTVHPRSLTFAAPDQEATFTLGNQGDEPLRLNGLTVQTVSNRPDSAFIVEPLTASTLQPGETLEARVRYLPGASSGRQSFAALLVRSNDAHLRPDPGDPTQFVAGVALRGGAQFPWLTWLIFFPLLGIPLLFLIPAGREAAARWVALAVSLVPLGIALFLAATFDHAASVAGGNYGLQFIEHAVWIRGFNVEYFLGVDGLSISMVVLTALVSVIAVGASWSIPLGERIRGYFALFLLLEVGMMGVFVALDFFLFFVFWEVMLLPMYFLIGLWGGPRREYAAIKFFLYTLAGSVLLLLSLIALYQASAPTFLVDGTPAAHTFDLMKLAHANSFVGAAPIAGFDFVKLVWVLLFIGFAVKVPVVPLHTWLPDAHVEAPTAISVVLAGVLLKMGVYGLLRINAAVLPQGSTWAADAVALLGVISIVWGALCAMAQTDLKRLVAYSSVSHMGYCLLGLAAGTPYGTTGALVQMFSHGLITAMLFLLVGVLYDRTHTRGLDDFGGVGKVMPRYAGFFGLAFMASLGLPGLSGFIGEALIFLGAFSRYTTLTILAGVALALTAAYHLGAIQRIVLGPFKERWAAALTGRDLSWRELGTLLPLALLVIGLGFAPMPLIGAVSTSVADLLRLLARAAPLAGLP